MSVNVSPRFLFDIDPEFHNPSGIHGREDVFAEDWIGWLFT